jgi:hypothetical protein
MKFISAPPSVQSLTVLTSLQQAVTKALERKRRLGQYAVVWKDGQPVSVEWNGSAIAGMLSK